MRFAVALIAAVALLLPAAAGARERARDARVAPAKVAAKACKSRSGAARRACVARTLRSTCRLRRYRAARDCRAMRRAAAKAPATVPAPVADPGPPAAAASPDAPVADAGGPAPDAVAGTAAGGGITPPVAKPPQRSRLQVSAREFSLTPSRTTLPSGVTRVEFANFGEDPHDLRARPGNGGADLFAFPSVAADARHTEDIDFTPGSWTFYCALPEHEVLGMKVTIAVG